MDLEYVLSGTSHLKILNTSVNSEEILYAINGIIKKVNGANDHKFSLLYNAYQEKNYGLKLNERVKDSIYTIHADSGGLQIVTQGLQITDKLKEDVYKNQAAYSDIAMSFDEIPVKLITGSSDKNDVSNRIFDIANMHKFAKATGANIKRQIEIFDEVGSKAKPLVIAQGGCIETYREWMNYCLDEIPQGKYDRLGGISLGGAALGNGLLEDVERASFVTKLPFPNTNYSYHILGVGSMSRILPYLLFYSSGYYGDDNFHLSYDSTTHASGITYGMYFDEYKPIDIDTNVNKIYEQVNEYFDLEGNKIPFDKFDKIIHNNTEYFNEDPLLTFEYYFARTALTCSSVLNFTKAVNRCVKSQDDLMMYCDIYHMSKEGYSLLNVKTEYDFKEYLEMIKYSMRSKRIKSHSPNTLEGFFND